MKKLISLMVTALMVLSMTGAVYANTVDDLAAAIEAKYPDKTINCKNLANTIKVGTSEASLTDSDISVVKGTAVAFSSTLNMADVRKLFSNATDSVPDSNIYETYKTTVQNADMTGSFTIEVEYDSNFTFGEITATAVKNSFSGLSEDIYDLDDIAVTKDTNKYTITVKTESGIKAGAVNNDKLQDITYKISNVATPNTDGTYSVKVKMSGSLEFSGTGDSDTVTLGTIKFASPEATRSVTTYTQTSGSSSSASAKVTVKADKESGAYTAGTEVKLSSNYSSAKIYYTTDGTTPEFDKNGNPQGTTKLYDGKIVLNEDMTLKAVATMSNFKKTSSVATYDYTVSGVDVAISPSAGVVKKGDLITIVSKNGVKIYYTTDGTEPAFDEDGNPTGTTKLYEDAIVADDDMTIKAVAVDEEGNASVVASEKYTVAYELISDHIAYIKGDEKGNFNPEMPITRAEVATIFARLTVKKMDVDYSASASFTDVSSNDWFASAVAYMEKAGIIKGYEDGSFRPNNYITRAEFAAIASRYDRLSEVTAVDFTDITAEHWAYKNINSAVDKGWVKGYEDGSFKPDANITRAETVTVVNRMLGRDAKTEFEGADLDKLTMFPDNASSHWAYYEVIEASNDHDVEE